MGLLSLNKPRVLLSFSLCCSGYLLGCCRCLGFISSKIVPDVWLLVALPSSLVPLHMDVSVYLEARGRVLSHEVPVFQTILGGFGLWLDFCFTFHELRTFRGLRPELSWALSPQLGLHGLRHLLRLQLQLRRLLGGRWWWWGSLSIYYMTYEI